MQLSMGVRFLVWIGRVAWLLGAAALAAWATGRVLNDRWLWSQYLLWIPSVIVVPAGIALIAIGIWLARLSRRDKTIRSGLFRPFLAITGLLGVVAAYTTLAIDLRLFSSASGDVPPPEHRLRVIHWNCSDDFGAQWTKGLLDLHPDLVIINPASYQPWGPIIEGMGPGAAVMFLHGFTIISKPAVTLMGEISLHVEPGEGIDLRQKSGLSARVDPGRAVWLQLDTRTQFGRAFTVWLLDLPSDISLPRWLVTDEAAKAIAESDSHPRVPKGQSGSEPADGLRRGFPPPDLVIGDMNIPRGSASLGRLTGGLANAYDQAGHGFVATWPYRSPLWHLDQSFIGTGYRATAYAALDLGGGTHRGQLVDVALHTAP